MKTVILAGGLGSRLAEETVVKPKPMVEIGGRPMLWHIMTMYAAFDFREFVVALGYKGEVIKSYFLHYYQMRNSYSIDLASGRIGVRGDVPEREDWRVHLVDTGDHTETGGRMKRVAPWLGSERFMMTYGDGVANLNIADLVAFHRHHGRLATMTVVHPPARFGAVTLQGDFVQTFLEKPQTGEGWINGGFFVLEPGVLDYVDSDETVWEGAPLQRLAQDGQLAAYRHTGFWHCMDTLRDVRVLNGLWERGQAPWAALGPPAGTHDHQGTAIGK